MKEYNVAILGCTGVVGQEMMKSLVELSIPVKTLYLLASSRSAGKVIKFKDKDCIVQDAEKFDFAGVDFVLGAVEKSESKMYAPKIVKAGAVFIDNSSAFRMDPDVPLVVPEINGEDCKKNKGIISNPNCSTIITLMAVAALAKISNIKSMQASTYQAVSGAGINGLHELENQIDQIAKGKPLECKVFPTQIANNVIPFIGGYTDNGYTEEEMKLHNEGRKILHMPSMNVTCTCVRVPVMRSHSISVTVHFENKITVEQAKKAISQFPGVKLADDIFGRDYPTPLDTTDQNLVYVGRIREDLTDPNGLTLWCCGDQIRKGAATNCVQILKSMI